MAATIRASGSGFSPVRCNGAGRAGSHDRPAAGFRRALQMSFPRTVVSVDAFHLVKLGNDMLMKSSNGSPSRSMAGVDVPSTRSGPTGDCFCGPWTRPRPGPNEALHRVSPPTTSPETAGCRAGRRTAPALGGRRFTNRRSSRERPPAGPGRTSLITGKQPALAHNKPVTEGNRSTPSTGATRQWKTITAQSSTSKGPAGDSPTPGTTKRLTCCAVPPEQRHEHPSRQNIHHEPRRAA